MKPDVSIIIEGYNESIDIGTAGETLQALRNQTYPLSRVEVFLVGSAQQAEAWRRWEREPGPFSAVRTVIADGEHYYELKNRGARTAQGNIIAFLDSDVMPEPGWLQALVSALESGAVASCGPSTFRQGELLTAGRLAMQVAASISWGFIAGPKDRAAGFLSHNLGFRRERFERLGYRDDLGRTCAGSFLLDDMKKERVEPVFVTAQRVAHAFQWKWWFSRLHVRFGHEVYLLHRMGVSTVSSAARRLGPLDAVATPVWHIALDFPRWWRYSAALDLPLWRRLAGFPLVLPLSLLARLGEMAGMVATAVSPARMKAFAARN